MKEENKKVEPFMPETREEFEAAKRYCELTEFVSHVGNPEATLYNARASAFCAGYLEAKRKYENKIN